MNRRALLAEAARKIIDQAEAEGREPTPEEIARSESIWRQFDALPDPLTTLPLDNEAEWTVSA